MIFHLLSLLGILGVLHGLEAQTQQPPASISLSSQQSDRDLMDIMMKLARGHDQFRRLNFKQDEEEFARLVVEGQSPQILFIGCSDSRVVPNLILSTRPGDLFVLRTAGNFVTPYQFQSVDGVAASIQYSVEVLNIPHIIVCGHSSCGAIQGLFKDLPDNLQILKNWLKLGDRTKQLTLAGTSSNTPPEELYAIAERVSVVIQLENLMTYPFVKKRVEEGKLKIHGWYFKIEEGDLYYFNNQKYQFDPLVYKKVALK